MRRFVLALALVALASPLDAQPNKGGPLSPADALKALKVADGFQVELFAAEPDLINPTSMDVDHKGRVWVAEAVNYRRKNFNRPIIREAGDRIQVLIDEKGAGKATKAVTFYQGKEIYGPLGVCVAPYADGKGQRVFVCQSPDILVFEDKDGDLKADGPPKKFLTGFGGFDHDHGVHGINIGPDGKLYFTVGDSGVTGLQSSDGKGKKWVSNATDVQKGTVWRCDMDGTNLELIAHNFRNNYECCVDSFGEVWLSDNDDDGNQQTRICFVMPGGNYGYGPRGAGQTHWHEEQPGIVHKTLRTGFGSPTGITFYEGSMFDKKYRGSLLHCDAGPREVRWFHRKPKGAGYELEKEVLLTSSDNWFRPSDVCVAPDGSIFVADWYDRGVGGHGMGDPTDGRIYRITPKGHQGYKVPEVKFGTNEEVIEAFSSPNLATRALAWAAFLANPKLPGESKKLDDLDAETAARAAWLTTQTLKDEKSKWVGLLPLDYWKSSDPRKQAMGVRLWRALVAGEVPRWLLNEFTAFDPAANRELLLWAREWPAATAAKVVYELAKKYDGSDHFYRAALNIACGTDAVRRDAILADFDKHFPEWNDKVADLVWELRPKSVLPRLGKLLADAKITAAQKARIVDILASNDDPNAGQSMLGVLKSDAPPEVKSRAIDNLKLFLPTKWFALKNAPELGQAIDALLKDEKTQITGLQLIAAAGATTRVQYLADLVEKQQTPIAVRREALATLGKLRTERAAEALADVMTARKDPLAPEAATALGALVTGQGNDAVSKAALGALEKKLQKDDNEPKELLNAILGALAGSRAGTVWLLDAHQQGKLRKELVAQAGQLLRNSPFQGERNRALLLFPAPGKLNPKALPAVAELAKRGGDASRGKAVWNASLTGAAQCAKCHMTRGVGGQVGPDLSMIGKKASRENLYESLLQPSKAIADQYVQHQVVTTSEVTVTGLLMGETPDSITLRDANGKDTTIPKKEVAGEVRKLKTSIMPEDIIAALTEDELVDLVAYLETLKTAAFTPDAFQMVGPFPAESMAKALDTVFEPERGPVPVPPNKWRALRPDGKGYFDLAAAHGAKAANSASYMYVEVESPVEQAAEILLGPDDGARLWVNGKEVHTSRESKAAAPEAHKVSVKLAKGTNTVLLKVANGDNPHGFYFSLTSAEEVKKK